MRGFRVVALLPLALWATAVAAQPSASRALEWEPATRDSRPWTRWWWMGSAVDSANITRELSDLARAGFGGVEVTSIYGVRGAESADVPYLSDRWVRLLTHTVNEAKRLGLGVDAPPGSGWKLGGPNTPPSDVGMSIRAVASDSGARVVIAPSNDDVKRPAPGGAGRAIDVFSPAAVTRYLGMWSERTRELPRGALRTYFHDSFEYSSTASSDLLAFFKERRGYDLASEAAALAGQGDSSRVARVKSDYRQTLDEMLLEHFARPFAQWTRMRGSLARNQAHGSPGNLLDLYAAADIPETEIFGPLGGRDSDPLISKFASSAAHVSGKRLTAAEAFTWLGEHFSATLGEVKSAADQLFVSGVNHLIYHGTAYSPQSAAWPGWQFYASAEFSPRNAFWRDLPAFNQYVTRVQSMLQAGKPSGDVLLYWPIWDSWHDGRGMRMDFRIHDPTWFHGQRIGEVAKTLWADGHAFDYVSDRALDELVSLRNGRLSTQGGVEYSVLVVPGAVHMPPATLERLLGLARGGATIGFVGDLPRDVPGLRELEVRRRALSTLTGSVALSPADSSGVRSAQLGSGRVLVAPTARLLLERVRTRREPMADRGLRFVRRRTSDGHVYFISNPTASTVDELVPLGVSARGVVLLDPMSGRTGIAPVAQTSGASVRLQLAPGQSILLRALERPITGRGWSYRERSGSAITLRGPWSVEFVDGGPTLPPAFTSDTLAFWTSRGDAEADRFAGTAKYTLRFDAPGSMGNHLLQLERVAESARVVLNGRVLGTLIAPPFEIETGPLRARGNVLEIEVTNLSANRIRDLDRRGVSWKIFRDINYVGIDYRPFDASKWNVRDSGLSGQVQLVPLSNR